MEENEMMEVKPKTVEVSESTETGSMDMLTGAIIGGAIVGGIWVLKKVVKPVASFVKMKIDTAKEKKTPAKKEHDFVDGEFQEEDLEE